MSLSVVISAYNAEKTIKACLESVKDLAQEIVFVDNSSTDNTPNIAKKYTEKIFTRPNYPMLNINKNFGISKAKCEWILVLDSDEVVSDELKEEIKNIVTKKENGPLGFYIPRRNIIFGKWIEHTGWYPDFQLRLFKRGFGQFPQRHVHEMLEISGKTAYLKNHIIHYNYDSVSSFLRKTFDIYAPNEAENLLKNGYKINYLDALYLPFQEFLRRFFAQEGYKDGVYGLVLSLLMAFYHFVVFCFVWEKENFQAEEKDLLSDLKKEAKVMGNELRFWYKKSRVENEKNILRKIFLKIFL
jgi:glycosyltransferase involved in cell wall biosynthesis